MAFTLYEIDNAPEPAASQLKESQDAFGFIPNIHKALAASPETLAAYKYLHDQFQASSFDHNELTVVWQTINYYHDCSYCIPAHTAAAHMMKVDPAIIEALHNGESLQDDKLSVLQQTTRAVVDQRGRLNEEQIYDFKSAGYGDKQLLEILLGLAQKVISNYTNHLAKTPLDAPFEQFAN